MYVLILIEANGQTRVPDCQALIIDPTPEVLARA